MSISFNGTTQSAHHTAAPSASSWCASFWVRRDADSGLYESPLASWDSTNNRGSFVFVTTGDGLVCYHQSSVDDAQSADALATFTTTVWRFIRLRYTGNTLTIGYLNDGDATIQGTASLTSLTNISAPDRLMLGASRTTGTDLMDCTIASVKVWSGGTLPTDAELLTERLYTDVTVTTGLWASYDFLTGALDTDRSGNTRTLTLTATPTFTADKPTDLTIGGASATPYITLQFNPLP